MPTPLPSAAPSVVDDVVDEVLGSLTSDAPSMIPSSTLASDTPSAAPSNSTIETSIALEDLYFLPHDTLLVSNTRGDEAIVQYNLTSGNFSSFIPTSAGLIDPDQMVYDEWTGDLYISHGFNLTNSAIAKLYANGTLDTEFATGGNMTRPYGFVIDNITSIMYVASFRTDEILMFNASTGDFLDVFAAGNTTAAGLLNGPNHMVIYNETTLFVTTQGSWVNVTDDSLNFDYASQVLMYDLVTGEGSVFADQPPLLNYSLGFNSFLGISILCDELVVVEGNYTENEIVNTTIILENCTMFTTDFGGGLRSYNLSSGELIYGSETTYLDIGNSTTGALAYVPSTGNFYIPGSVNSTYGASLMAFDAETGEPAANTTFSDYAETGEPTGNATAAIVVQDDVFLSRPIGITYIPPEPIVEVVLPPPITKADRNTASGAGTVALASSMGVMVSSYVIMIMML
jgi:hypothetical protein